MTLKKRLKNTTVESMFQWLSQPKEIFHKSPLKKRKKNRNNMKYLASDYATREQLDKAMRARVKQEGDTIECTWEELEKLSLNQDRMVYDAVAVITE